VSTAVFGDQYVYSKDEAGAAAQAWAKRVSWAQGTEVWVEAPGMAGQGHEGLWMLSGS